MTEHFEQRARIEKAVAGLDLPKGWDLRVEIRPRRRSLGLELKPGEAVKVLVPPHASLEQVAEFVCGRRSWLAKNIPEARQLAPEFAIKEFVDGEEFALLGRTYRLRLTAGGTPARTERVADALGATEFLYLPHIRVEAIRNAVITLYRDRGLAWAKQHGERYERHGGIQGVRYEVRNLGWRRWGAYSPAKHLVSLHWPLFGLPLELIEYVLVHELAHATRPSGQPHGPAWQRQMNLWMPDWRQRKTALAQAGRRAWMGDCQPT
ncbi:YgjP-like metallopeptidase domain-containing protein [Saccharopolyspora shandongensis]|uniref:M48 family metallopeptidase n=1 Tax=Saccharopolyspora shandongensis TaxID=418495 RepID=UPI00341FA598